jgi:hypothetical protein
MRQPVNGDEHGQAEMDHVFPSWNGMVWCGRTAVSRVGNEADQAENGDKAPPDDVDPHKKTGTSRCPFQYETAG